MAERSIHIVDGMALAYIIAVISHGDVIRGEILIINLHLCNITLTLIQQLNMPSMRIPRKSRPQPKFPELAVRASPRGHRYQLAIENELNRILLHIRKMRSPGQCQTSGGVCAMWPTSTAS